MTDKVIVLTSAGSEAEASKIARALVERKLAACVNIVPKIQSVYRWKGEIEEAEESLLIVKTGRTQQDEVSAAIRELHSYELPECVVLAIDGGSEKYLAWITDSLAK